MSKARHVSVIVWRCSVASESRGYLDAGLEDWLPSRQWPCLMGLLPSHFTVRHPYETNHALDFPQLLPPRALVSRSQPLRYRLAAGFPLFFAWFLILRFRVRGVAAFASNAAFFAADLAFAPAVLLVQQPITDYVWKESRDPASPTESLGPTLKADKNLWASDWLIHEEISLSSSDASSTSES